VCIQRAAGFKGGAITSAKNMIGSARGHEQPLEGYARVKLEAAAAQEFC